MPVLGLIAGVATLAAGPSKAWAQASCGASIDPTIQTAPDFNNAYFVGTTITLSIELGVGTIQTGSEIVIPEVQHALDCFDDGFLASCMDAGPRISYNGDGSLFTNCVDGDGGPVMVMSDGSGTDPNIVTFTFMPAVVLPEDSSCTLAFDVTINDSPAQDSTPSFIEGATGYSGTCDNGLVGQGNGTIAVEVVYCGDDIANIGECSGGANSGDACDTTGDDCVGGTCVAIETCDGTDDTGCNDTCRPPDDPNECTCCGDGIVQDGSGETCDGSTPNDNPCRDDCTFCGDGIVQTGEMCDEGPANSDAPDATCRTDCTPQVCGDMIIDPGSGETCDGENDAGCNDECRDPGSTDQCTCCGDGVVQEDSGETCDGDIAPNGNECRVTCTYCGDGNLDPGEDCDAGPLNSNDPDAPCRPDCTPPICGDMITDPGMDETCDPPGQTQPNGNDCRENCTYCGDGVEDLGEECDAGALNSNDPDAPCRPDCTLPECGDNITDPGMDETCDGSDAADCNAAGCRAPGSTDECTCCGDGIVQPDSDETCDADIAPNGNDCRDNCTYCGDGVEDPGEQCDEGTDNSDEPGATCRTNCTTQECGDGIIDPAFGETCDGEALGSTSCDDCRAPGTVAMCTCCGDGEVQTAAGEQCDLGDLNGAPGSGCRDDCTIPVCGDELLDPGETCDGDTGAADCNADGCREPGTDDECTCCGDGELQEDSETCDPNDPDGPENCRVNCTYCGDGVKDLGEECDLGDDNSDEPGSMCRTDCTMPLCGDGIIDPPLETCDGDAGDCNADGCRPPGTADPCTCCGDGLVQEDSGETCDGDIAPNGNECRVTCTYCGDGNMDPGEACDAGALNSNDPDAPCRPDCTLPFCGDTIVDPGMDESCDPPGQTQPNGNDCRVNCTYCGDGNMDPGEECDAGILNSNDPDAPCRPDCMLPECGDMITDPGMDETCDGSDAADCNAEGCRAPGSTDQCTCCGDGVIQPDSDETCDGDPAPNGSDCRVNCTYCGDGNMDPGEECDAGALNSNDPDAPCRPDCTLPFCGDMIVDPGMDETCDPPGQTQPNGNDCRVNCTYCGDGNLDFGEECDLGDLNTDDPFGECTTECTFPECFNKPIIKCAFDILDETDGECGVFVEVPPPGVEDLCVEDDLEDEVLIVSHIVIGPDGQPGPYPNCLAEWDLECGDSPYDPCWDLNGNNDCDIPDGPGSGEDLNGDNMCDEQDCVCLCPLPDAADPDDLPPQIGSDDGGCFDSIGDPVCPPLQTTCDGNASAIYPVGTSTITWTVYNPETGLRAMCDQKIWVEDADPPVLECVRHEEWVDTVCSETEVCKDALIEAIPCNIHTGPKGPVVQATDNCKEQCAEDPHKAMDWEFILVEENGEIEITDEQCLGLGVHWLRIRAKDCAEDHIEGVGEVPNPNYSEVACDIMVNVILGTECPPECVAEGDSYAIAPGQPGCCPGLESVGCDEPDADGECQGCVGASFCTNCGDGECGPGENECRCPEDCPPAAGGCDTALDCDDGVLCTDDECVDEECVYIPNDDLCDLGETCDPGAGCQTNGDPVGGPPAGGGGTPPPVVVITPEDEGDAGDASEDEGEGPVEDDAQPEEEAQQADDTDSDGDPAEDDATTVGGQDDEVQQDEPDDSVMQAGQQEPPMPAGTDSSPSPDSSSDATTGGSSSGNSAAAGGACGLGGSASLLLLMMLTMMKVRRRRH